MHRATGVTFRNLFLCTFVISEVSGITEQRPGLCLLWA